MNPSTVLVLPGWQNSGPQHWQSRWERLHGFRRVEQHDWMRPLRGDWTARLEEVVLAHRAEAGAGAGLVLVAHSLGCQLVAAWAAHSRHTERVAAALLVAPPDTEREDMPPQLFNWRPIVRERLPFASLVVASSNDPYCALPRAERMAADWGAAIVEIGARGHINGESGLGDWPEGLALLRALANEAG